MALKLLQQYSVVIILLPILPMKGLITLLLLSFSTVIADDKPNIIGILADEVDSIGPNWT